MDGQGEGKRRFRKRVFSCPGLTSITREETTSVVMIKEVTTRCSPVSSLFDSLLFYCCLSLCCSQHAGRAHQQRPVHSHLPLPRQHSMILVRPFPSHQLHHSVSFHFSQAPLQLCEPST